MTQEVRPSDPIRVMVERGWKNKRWVASVFDWPGTIRRCAYHMLDHAWEIEDRDPSRGT